MDTTLISADTMMMGGLLATLAATGFNGALERSMKRKDKRYTCEILFSDVCNSRDKLLLFKLLSDFGKKNSKMKKFQTAYATMKRPTPRRVQAYENTGYVDEYGDPIMETVYNDQNEPHTVLTSHEQVPFNLPKQGFDVIDKEDKKTSIKPIIQAGDLQGYEFRMSHTFVNVLYDVLRRSKDHFDDDKECIDAFQAAFHGCLSPNTNITIHCPANQVSFWSTFGECLKIAAFVVSGAAIITGIVLAAVYCWPVAAFAAAATAGVAVSAGTICTCIAIVATAVVSVVLTACAWIASWFKWW